MNFIRFSNWGSSTPHPKHTYLCGWNTLNLSFSYFIFRIGTKRHFMLTKRRYNFTFNSAMLQMIRWWNSIIKIKFPGDKKKTWKITFQGTKYFFIDITTCLLASHKVQVLSFQKREYHEIWISIAARTIYLNHFHSMVLGNL